MANLTYLEVSDWVVTFTDLIDKYLLLPKVQSIYVEIKDLDSPFPYSMPAARAPHSVNLCFGCVLPLSEEGLQEILQLTTALKRLNCKIMNERLSDGLTRDDLTTRHSPAERLNSALSPTKPSFG